MDQSGSIDKLLAHNTDRREEVQLNKEYAEAYELLYTTLNNTCQEMYGHSLRNLETPQYDQ